MAEGEVIDGEDEVTDAEVVGALLRTVRLRHGLNQQELSRELAARDSRSRSSRSGLSQAAISKFENGSLQLKDTKFALLLETLGVQRSQLDAWTERVKALTRADDLSLDVAAERVVPHDVGPPFTLASTPPSAPAEVLTSLSAAAPTLLPPLRDVGMFEVVEVPSTAIGLGDDDRYWIDLEAPAAPVRSERRPDAVRVQGVDDGRVVCDLPSLGASVVGPRTERQTRRLAGCAWDPDRREAVPLDEVTDATLEPVYFRARVTVELDDVEWTFAASDIDQPGGPWPFTEHVHEVHVLTACNPSRGPLLTAAEGEAANLRLRELLEGSWAGVHEARVEADSVDHAWIEPSFAVLVGEDDVPRATESLREVAIQFGQQAWYVLTPRELRLEWTPPHAGHRSARDVVIRRVD